MDEKRDRHAMTMDRRNFVKLGGLGVGAVVTAGTTACAPDTGATRGAADDAPWWTTETFELEEVTFAGLMDDMAAAAATRNSPTPKRS